MAEEPKIDFKVLDEAVKKVLSAPPQPKRKPNPESTEGGRRVSVLKRQEGAPVLLG